MCFFLLSNHLHFLCLTVPLKFVSFKIWVILKQEPPPLPVFMYVISFFRREGRRHFLRDDKINDAAFKRNFPALLWNPSRMPPRLFSISALILCDMLWHHYHVIRFRHRALCGRNLCRALRIVTRFSDRVRRVPDQPIWKAFAPARGRGSHWERPWKLGCGSIQLLNIYYAVKYWRAPHCDFSLCWIPPQNICMQYFSLV